MYRAQCGLSGADFFDATVTGASFDSSNVTAEQLYATASYQARNLQDISLSGVALLGSIFTGQNLAYASLLHSNLEGADFRHANLSHADLRAATVCGVDFSGADIATADLGRVIGLTAILGRAKGDVILCQNRSYHFGRLAS